MMVHRWLDLLAHAPLVCFTIFIGLAKGEFAGLSANDVHSNFVLKEDWKKSWSITADSFEIVMG